MSTIEDLADHIASSIASNKLEQLTTLLAHPLAQDVMRINSGSRLRLACVKNRLDFIDVLVEYCGDQEIGGALHFCLTNLRLKSFDRIVQHKPHSGAYMAVTTLDLLLDLHTTRLNTFETPLQLQALERFLDWVPQTHIDDSLAVTLNYCRSDPSKIRRIDAFDALVAQRQKTRLEQEIEMGQRAPVRKI